METLIRNYETSPSHTYAGFYVKMYLVQSLTHISSKLLVTEMQASGNWLHFWIA